MDPEQTFIRVQERFSEMLTPKIRAKLEYLFLLLAITLFCILVVMHANYVQQIISSGLWSHNETYVVYDNGTETAIEIHKAAKVEGDDSNFFDSSESWLSSMNDDEKRRDSFSEIGKVDSSVLESQGEASMSSESMKPASDDVKVKVSKDATSSIEIFFLLLKEYLGAAIVHLVRKWHGHVFFFLRLAKRILAVSWLEKRCSAFEPTYLYTMEKGYILLPEEARSRHNICTINISISPRHNCFGNRWQQLLVNWLVGYETILLNSLLNTPGQGYLYNYQTKEFYNLTYAHDQLESYANFGDYLVTKCGVLLISLFVFFTTTMSVSFILRETQTRTLKFTVQLQHHARHRLPTFQLIFVHVIESLVFVPIMIGILFFLFEFYDDQLLAFTVLILVWICELFTLVSVRTPISMKFFPRFFLLYFVVFHIYLFSYTYGFSYLALATCAAFMQHLILYFWNKFEVPALHRFMQSRRSHFMQRPDLHITSSTILASTLHVTRLNTHSSEPANTGLAQGPVLRPILHQPEAGGVPGRTNLLSGASSENLRSFLSIFRDVRDNGRVYAQPSEQEISTTQNDND